MSTNRGKACLMLNFCMHTNCANMAYQSFRLKGVQLEASEKLPQGYMDCGSQEFIATLFFDPSMSALPIIETQGLVVRVASSAS